MSARDQQRYIDGSVKNYGAKLMKGTARRGSRLMSATALALLAFTAGGASTARAQSAPAQVVRVGIGMHHLLRESEPVGRVAIGNPTIAEVSVVSPREVLITGNAFGVTSLLVWPKVHGRTAADAQEYRVQVAAVSAAPQDPETANMDVEPGSSIDGQAPNLLAHQRAEMTAVPPSKGQVADRSSVDMTTQVMTGIKIVEVQRSTAQKYGLNVFKNSGNTIAGVSTPSSISGVSSTAAGLAFTSSSGFLPVQNAFNILVGNPQDGLLGLLSLLESKGLARTLAEPSLTAMSGQTASFLAGGEFPVPVAQTSGSGSGNAAITVQYHEYGVRLNLTPTVLSPTRIAMKVAPEVSELDFSAGIQISGTAVPALTVRRTDTTVELGDGESFVLSGLVSDSQVNNVNKIPWLGDVPVLGAFFRSTSISRTEKELIMIVTPHLVRPLARGAKLPPLPGEAAARYRPSFAETMFLENGSFGTDDYGYSH